MIGSKSGFKRNVKVRAAALLKEAAGPIVALAIHYPRYIELLPLFLWRCAKFAADVEFWFVVLAVMIGILAKPTTAALLIIVALLWWALVLIMRDRNRVVAESPGPTTPAAEQVQGKVVDIHEYRTRNRRREDRGGGRRRVA